MSSRTLREITTADSGNGTGLPFGLCCYAWFLKELLGFTNYSDLSLGGPLLGAAHGGTAGEFNLTGTDKDFRDSVAAGFGPSDVGKWIVVKDNVSRNCGIYKITAFVSTTTVTIDFRSGATEYPTASTGITWWVIGSVALAANGSIAFANGDAFTYGTFARLNDGQGCNYDRALVWYPAYHYVSPLTWLPYAWTVNNWMGGVIATSMFTRWNDLVGKTINLTVGTTTQSVIFIGTNPLDITSVVNQINVMFGSYTKVCYESDSIGNERPGGGYLTFRAQLIGKNPGQPDLPASNYQYSGGPQEGGPALNNLTLTYSGSTAWSYLGLSGTSNLSAAAITTSVRAVDNRSDMTPTPSTTIAGWCTTDINAWVGDLFSAVTAGSSTNITNTIVGAHGNRTMLYAGTGITPVGMANGFIPTTDSDGFRCKTPHARGWEIEIVLHSPRVAPFFRVRIATNGRWDEQAKIIGPVYFGSVASAVNWVYAEGNNDGSSVNLFVHQATNDRHNGVLAANLEVFETSHTDPEKVVLMGNISSSSTNYDNGNFIRSYDDYRIGHGYVWDDTGLLIHKNVYMLEMTYSSYVNGLCKWTSRERNRRRSGSQVGAFTGDSITMSGSVATLTKSTATFIALDVGRKIRISGCTNAGNNGVFTITAWLGATQIQYTNASGVNETSSFSWSMDYQDIATGTLIVCDVNNYSGQFEIVGRISGHYSTRSGTTSGWSNRKAFCDSGFLDKFHVTDGISIEWPNVTPQH